MQSRLSTPAGPSMARRGGGPTQAPAGRNVHANVNVCVCVCGSICVQAVARGFLRSFISSGGYHFSYAVNCRRYEKAPGEFKTMDRCIVDWLWFQFAQHSSGCTCWAIALHHANLGVPVWPAALEPPNRGVPDDRPGGPRGPWGSQRSREHPFFGFLVDKNAFRFQLRPASRFMLQYMSGLSARVRAW